MDAISVVKDDHRTVKELFETFEKLGDRAVKSIDGRQDHPRTVDPRSDRRDGVVSLRSRERAGARDTILEALEEHLVAKWELAALEDMDPGEERFDAKVAVLIASVRHHVTEEEREVLAKLRATCSRADLQELGELLQRAKQSASTHPHPRMPDAPPGNVVAGMAGAVVGRARDLGKETVDRVRHPA